MRILTPALTLAFLLVALAAPRADGAKGKADTKIADSKIAAAIDSELWGARAVNANNIDVTVVDGVAQLSGEVNNLLSRDRALRIAKMTKGVRSVVSSVSVAPEYRNDKEIQRDIKQALINDPATESWKVRVNVRDGVATWNGGVESFAQQQLAEKLAKSVRGTRGVVNKIAIDYDALRSDSDIQAEVEQRLSWDVRLDDEMIDVSVDDGEVKLFGSVGSDYEKTLARWDAWVTGVQGVNDEALEVNWWSRDDMQRKQTRSSLNDEEIRDAVKGAFALDPRVFTFSPQVSVDSGVVTLTGSVHDLKAKRSAAQDAMNTVGVSRVKNHLKVRPLVDRSDKEIKSVIHEALQRDPFVDRFEITIAVHDGEASLYGDVDSYFERAHADDIAAKVRGVTGVFNYLDVGYEYPNFDYGFYDWDPTLYDFDFDYETVQRKPDREIAEDVESELFWSPWVDSDQITIEVEDGVATLTGEVDNWSQRKSASENAIEGGAVKVINKLDVTL